MKKKSVLIAAARDKWLLARDSYATSLLLGYAPAILAKLKRAAFNAHREYHQAVADSLVRSWK